MRFEKYYEPKFVDDKTNLSKMIINPITHKLEMPKFFRRSVTPKKDNGLPICPKCHNVLPLSGGRAAGSPTSGNTVGMTCLQNRK